ncbi:MAG TPA: hypothetical protein VIS95_01770 [Solirubrobacterales bacterium]
MRTLAAIVGLAAVGLACAPAATAVAHGTSSPRALLAGIAQLDDQLALLGSSSDAGRSDEDDLLAIRFVNHDGYTFRLFAFSQTVVLSVIRRDRKTRPSSTTYLARGVVTSSSIEASFGDRGRVSLRFRPSRRPARATRRVKCTKSGNPVAAHLGLFVGTLRFRGEGGYTSAEVQRVHGGSLDPAAFVACQVQAIAPPRQGSPSPPGRQPSGLATLRNYVEDFGKDPPEIPGVDTRPSEREETTALIAHRKTPLTRTVFVALNRGQGQARFLALDAGVDGSLGILRFVSVPAPVAAFRTEDTLSGASVSPPSPFSGTAIFQHGGGREKSFAGSLAVSFLGAPGVPLADSTFETLLLRGR